MFHIIWQYFNDDKNLALANYLLYINMIIYI